MFLELRTVYTEIFTTSYGPTHRTTTESLRICHMIYIWYLPFNVQIQWNPLLTFLLLTISLLLEIEQI